MKRDPSLEPLSHDHYEGLQFVARLRKGVRSGDDPASLLREMAAFWQSHLAHHFSEEESVLLPLLPPSASAMGERMLHEHGELKGRARSSGNEVEATLDAVTAFADALAAHIRFEERDLFPYLEQHLDAETLRVAGERLRAERGDAGPN